MHPTTLHYCTVTAASTSHLLTTDYPQLFTWIHAFILTLIKKSAIAGTGPASGLIRFAPSNYLRAADG
jgi:hypothetical protein